MEALQFLSFFMKIYIFSHAPRIDSKLSRNLSQLQNLCFLRENEHKQIVRDRTSNFLFFCWEK